MPEPFDEQPQEIEEPQMEQHHDFEPMPEEHEEEHHRPARKGPLFVGVQDYQQLLNSVASIKGKLAETDDSFKKLSDIKTAQDKALEDWHAVLGNVQKKLSYVDDVLFER